MPPFTVCKDSCDIPRHEICGIKPIQVVARNQVLLPSRPGALQSIAALILREMATTYGRSPGGYLWAILEPVAAIALLSFAFSLVFHAPSLGASFPLFYATAYLPYMLFHDVSTKTAQAIRFSRPLLNFNAVAWVDVLLARFALNFFTHLLVGSLVIGAMLLFFETRASPDLVIVAIAIGTVGLLAFGVGTLNAFLFLSFPVWERIWTIATRPLFIVSGIFFLFEDAPAEFRDALWFNPLFHVTGLMRKGFYSTYDANYVFVPYGFSVGAGLLVLGLMLLSRYGDELVQR